MLGGKMRLSVWVILLSAVALAAPENPILSRYRVVPKSPKAMDSIAEHYEVLKRDGKAFEVIVPQKDAAHLLSLTESSSLLEADLRDTVRSALRKWEAGYHNFELKDTVAKFPTLATLEEYGKSMENRPLLALKLTGKEAPNKPEIMLTAATHGDELITVEVLLGLLSQLTKSYGSDSRLTKILDSAVIYFIPVVNPDGYVRSERYSNGVDPNRDYPWPEKPERNPNPCIKAVINFFHAHAIKGSIDFHAYGEMIMYPWAYTYSPVSSELHEPLERVTGQMASHNGYVHGQISDVIYVAKGSSADYYLWKKNTLALGIEMATTKVPSVSQIPAILKDNTESTWTFIESFLAP